MSVVHLLRRDREERRLPVLVSALALFAGLLVGAAAAPASAADLVYFTDADRTVACEIAVADEYDYYDKIRCDLLGAGVPTPLPPRDPNCPAEWAAVVLMDENDVQLPQWGACVGDSIANGEALPAGAVVEAGSFRCLVLDEGVRCRNTDSRYGFELSHATYKTTRPAAKSQLSPAGIGKLRLGYTIKRAKRTGWIAAPVCGNPQLKKRLHMRAWLTWHKGRLSAVLANSSSNVQAKKGVGVGSTLRQVRAKYRGRVVVTKDRVDNGAKAYVYIVRAKSGLMVFLLQTPSGLAPSTTTPVNAIWVTRAWNPKRGYGFSGC